MSRRRLEERAYKAFQILKCYFEGQRSKKHAAAAMRVSVRVVQRLFKKVA